MAKESIYPAFKIDQPGLKNDQAIYSAVIPVKDLIDDTAFKVDFWKKELEGKEAQGYQRIINASHKKGIANFLKDEQSILPTAVLLSTREAHPDFGNNGIVFKKFPVHIVDGQHRIAGLRTAIQDEGVDRWKDASLPVIVLSGFSKYEEIVQFLDLNTKQKKIDINLALELMSDMAGVNPKIKNEFIEKEIDWKVRAIRITNKLNSDKKGPWHNSIKMAGDESIRGSYKANSNSFAVSLKPLVHKGAFHYNLDLEKNLEIMSNFWWCLREIFSDAFLEPRQYAIQKTPGLFSLHTLLQAILSKRGYEFGLRKNELKKLLENIFDETEEIDVDFWRSDNRGGVTMYGSMKGFRLLSEIFIEALNKVG